MANVVEWDLQPAKNCISGAHRMRTVAPLPRNDSSLQPISLLPDVGECVTRGIASLRCAQGRLASDPRNDYLRVIIPPMSPAEQVARLREQIERANNAYYINDAPEISDAEYDRLFRELQALEAAHPDLQSPDSPTQRIGATAATSLGKHTHRVPMLSLANAFTAEELAEWEERNAYAGPSRLSSGISFKVGMEP